KYKSPYLKFCFNKPPVLEDKGLHVADMFEKVVEGAAASMPLPAGTRSLDLSANRKGMVVPPDLLQWADQAVPKKPRLALYIDAPVRERVWPAEQFGAVADFAMEQLNAQPIVIAGKEGQHLANRLGNASRNPDEVAFFTGVSIPQMAALIASSRL